MNATGSTEFYFMPGEELPALKAWSLMGGQGRLGYDIEHSDFILSIGANFLESWGTVARNRRAYRAGRPAGQTLLSRWPTPDRCRTTPPPGPTGGCPSGPTPKWLWPWAWPIC